MGQNYSGVDTELQGHGGWVLWRYGKQANAHGKYPKEPFQTHKPYYHARVNKPDTWAPYDETKHVYWPKRDNGVGIVLDGSGLAGMDYDGTTSKDAVDHAYANGARYIEVSPSGNGFRALGYFEGDIGRKQGVVDGLNLEVYNTGRFLTVTGNAVINEPLIDLNLAKVSDSLTTPQGTQGTQGTQGNQVRCVCVEDVVLSRFLPAQTGQRNSFEFRLAQYLRGQFLDATVFDCMEVVERWYLMARPIIGTKDWETTWLDFCRAFDDVKFPGGCVMDSIVEGFNDDPAPPGVDTRLTGYAMSLAKLCYRLQQQECDDPFYLSWRKAHEWLGTTDHKYAGKVIRGLCAMRIIELVTPGEKGRGGNASTYRFIAGEQ